MAQSKTTRLDNRVNYDSGIVAANISVPHTHFTTPLNNTTNLAVYADGSCQPCNPGGYACWAWLALDGNDHEVASGYGCAEHGVGATNNLAEYYAVLKALRWIAERAAAVSVELCTDSLLVVNQISGLWSCSAEHLQPLRDEAAALLARTNATLRWIPREQNTRADALSRVAYQDARRKEAQ